MAIRCIAFDLDDTLWDCASVIANAERHQYDWLRTRYPAITTRYELPELVQNRAQYMREFPELHHDLGRLRRQWLHQLAHEHGYDETLVEPAFQAFWQVRNQVTFFPNVIEQLQSLQPHYRLGVITNGNADVHHIGIGHLFHFTHTSAEAGVAKPDPGIFQQALAKAGTEAHETVYVGDDPERDIIGANRAGWKTIWYNPQQQARPPGVNPDGVMTSFAELPRLITLL